MTLVILGYFLILLGLLAMALQRFYSCVPAKELKRLAARRDPVAAALYRPVAYGASMRLFVWAVVGLALSVGYLLVIYNLPPVVAFLTVIISLGALVWLQSLHLSVHTARLAVWTSPVLTKVMIYLHGPLSLVARGLNSLRLHEPHSGIYEKADLIALLSQQKEQLDNRMALHELELIERAVNFDDHKAADIVMPMSKVKRVSADDHIGPILLGELHDSSQTSFIVYQDSPDNVVGAISLRDAVHAKAGGKVLDIVHRNVCFVHEDFSLRQVMNAFVRTGQFVVVVINSFEEAVGVITLQHLLAQLIGTPNDNLDAYEDRAAVASFVPALQPVEEPIVDELPSQDEDHQSSPEATEVVK